MRTLISVGIVMACAASTSVAALAQQSMGAHPMPAMSHAGRGGHGGDMHHHLGHRLHSTTSVPFGFWDWTPPPDVVVVQPQETGAETIPPPPQAPPTQTADLPPCRETTSDGVVVLRGMTCSRGGH